MTKFRRHFWVFFIVDVLLIVTMAIINIHVLSLDITKKSADGVVIADSRVRLIYKDDSIEEVEATSVGLDTSEIKVGDCYHMFFNRGSGAYFSNMPNKEYYEGVMNYRVELSVTFLILIFTCILRLLPEKKYEV